MLAYGDTESVNLRTGESLRRLTGNGESRIEECFEEAVRQMRPLIENERLGERITQEIMGFRMR